MRINQILRVTRETNFPEYIINQKIRPQKTP